MRKQESTARESMTLNPVGTVRWSRNGGPNQLVVDEPYRDAMKAIERFRHLVVLWWCGDHDDTESRSVLQEDLPYAPGEVAGVFACRSPQRPNPLGMSTVTVRGVDHAAGTVDIGAIDAFDGSQILDIKPYMPVFERVRDVEIPDYYKQWPGWDWYPEDGVPPYEELEA